VPVPTTGRTALLAAYFAPRKSSGDTPGENRARRNARDGIRGLLVYCSLLGDSAEPWAGEVRLSETLSPLRLKDERQPSLSHAQAAEILVGKRIRPSSIGSQSLAHGFT